MGILVNIGERKTDASRAVKVRKQRREYIWIDEKERCQDVGGFCN